MPVDRQPLAVVPTKVEKPKPKRKPKAWKASAQSLGSKESRMLFDIRHALKAKNARPEGAMAIRTGEFSPLSSLSFASILSSSPYLPSLVPVVQRN